MQSKSPVAKVLYQPLTHLCSHMLSEEGPSSVKGCSFLFFFFFFANPLLFVSSKRLIYWYCFPFCILKGCFLSSALCCGCCSVIKSYPTLCGPTARLLCPPLSPRVCSNSGPLSRWCHPQPSHPLSSPSPLDFSLSQHQGLFQEVGSLNKVVKVLELQLQHQSFQWISRVDLL